MGQIYGEMDRSVRGKKRADPSGSDLTQEKSFCSNLHESFSTASI